VVSKVSVSSDIVIEVENLSKQYRLGEVSTGSLHHDVNRWWHRVRGKEDPYLSVTGANIRTGKVEGKQRGTTENAENAEGEGKTLGSRAMAKSHQSPVSSLQSDSEYVWALKDINFEVKRGEVLGIIGRNGAGKSTLLKIMSRITAPTTGEVRVKGRIASLLEVGTGFHQDLTGRENVYLNGAVLGMTRAEIAGKLDEIVEFSGCARYIDTPVKRYSSGMVVRLGFAVAAHLEPEILIVDEVLAVGDAEFQKKCIGKMQEVATHGRTVLFVSHNLAAVQNLCQTAIWLDCGVVAHDRDAVAHVVSAYEQSGQIDAGIVLFLPKQHRTQSCLQIQSLGMLHPDGQLAATFKYGEPICVRLQVVSTESVAGVRLGIAVRSNGVVLSTWQSPPRDYSANDAVAVDCTVPGGVLLPGIFEIDVGAFRAPGMIGLDYIKEATRFVVSDVGMDRTWVHDRLTHGLVRIVVDWSS